MTVPDDSPPTVPTVPRRPPRLPADWASVTRLGIGDQARPVPVAAVQGALAISAAAADRGGPDGAATSAPRTPELRLVEGSSRGSDDVQVWAARFAQGVVEVLGGDRPLPQLVRWTSHAVYLDLDRRLRILGMTTGAVQRSRTVRPQVRSVHVCHPTPESAEVSVHVRHGQRSRALAARLELRQGRWQCTALQLG